MLRGVVLPGVMDAEIARVSAESRGGEDGGRSAHL